MIPMVDLKTQYHNLKEEIDQALQEVLESSQFILGPNVSAFEQEAADYLGADHAVAVASGTDALHLALLAAGIGPGDEVITPTFTFIATAEAVRYVGATPVFVDIDSRTFNIDPQKIEGAITPRTRAVIPVHLFGQPAHLKPIVEICERHNLLIIEDCAQSFGATADGRKTGTYGTAGCYSFFPSKNLGCYGDGGLVVCRTAEMADRLRMLRNHGSRQRYHHDLIGFNSRLDEMQAAILRVKLRHIDEFNEGRRRVASRYNELLWDMVQTPLIDGNGLHVYHQYTVMTNYRELIMEKLAEADIASAIYYPIPLHRQAVFAEAYSDSILPVAEHTASRCLSLPIYPEMPEESIQRVAETVSRALIGS